MASDVAAKAYDLAVDGHEAIGEPGVDCQPVASPGHLWDSSASAGRTSGWPFVRRSRSKIRSALRGGSVWGESCPVDVAESAHGYAGTRRAAVAGPYRPSSDSMPAATMGTRPSRMKAGR